MIWEGGCVEAILSGTTIPSGTVLKIDRGAGGPSRNVLFKDFAVKGYAHSSAIGITGDYVTLINPTITDPDGADANCIRVGGGTGFRCYGGCVESGGDAALQFSTVPGEGISDGYYIGTQATSVDGRLLLVGTQYGSIHQVGFIGVSGSVSGDGTLAKIQNDTASESITQVLYRDVSIGRPVSAINKDGFVIENNSSHVDGIADISFENLRIDYPGGTGLRVYTTAVGATPVRNLTWRVGRISEVDAGGVAISLGAVDGALFAAVDISGTTNQPMVLVGSGARSRNVAFEDTSVAGVAAAKDGIVFDQATACGFIRGTIAGAATATAVRLGSASAGCFVTGVDLSAIGADPKVAVDAGATAPLVRDNRGCAQRTPLNLGGAVTAPASTQAITAVTTRAAATASGAVNTVAGGGQGQLLIVSAPSGTITLKDAVANLRLRANIALDSPDDTALLIRRGADWLEVSERDNA